MSNANVAVVIEDDIDIRTLISTVLGQCGFAVHTAAAGLDGIDLVKSHSPALTTLDISMPGIDGVETARRLRRFSATRILMVSARVDDAQERAARAAGADDYLYKPFRPRELRERVRLLMGGDDLDQSAMPNG